MWCEIIFCEISHLECPQLSSFSTMIPTVYNGICYQASLSPATEPLVSRSKIIDTFSGCRAGNMCCILLQSYISQKCVINQYDQSFTTVCMRLGISSERSVI